MIKRAYFAVVSFLVLFSTVFATNLTAIDNKITEKPSASQMSIVTTETPVVIQSKTTECSETEIVETEQNTTVEETVTSSMTTETALIVEEKIYTEDDLFNLAAGICREAGGSSEEIQLLVGNVIINRVNSTYYPNTIYDVLTQRSQYGMMWKYGVSFPDWADTNTKNHCYEVAERLLEGERVCPENVLFQAEFKQGTGVYKEFDGFYFCYHE